MHEYEQVRAPADGWRERAEQIVGPLEPYASPTLSASEIGQFAYCFVPMAAGPSGAVLRTVRNGASYRLEPCGPAVATNRSTSMIHTSRSSAVRSQRFSISAYASSTMRRRSTRSPLLARRYRSRTRRRLRSALTRMRLLLPASGRFDDGFRVARFLRSACWW